MSKTSTKKQEPMTAFDASAISYEMIAVKWLIIKWSEAQRRLKSDAHATNIAANFDPEKFGTIVVTLPDDRGFYHVIDGFNRVQAVMIAWNDKEQMVPCQVLPIKDPIRAAQIFLGLNRGRKPVTAIDNFRVGVRAGDPDKVEINKIIKGLGYRVDPHNNKTEGCISAVGALSSVYHRFGPGILKSTLEVLQATWGLDSNAVSSPHIQGYAYFLAQYGDKANWGRLKDVIQKRFTPGQLLGAARTLRESQRNGLNDAVVHVILNAYNRGLKNGALQPK